MRLLLDTHVVLLVVNDETDRLPAAVVKVLADADSEYFVSVASFWEIAIKVRLGNLALNIPLAELEPACDAFAMSVIAISGRHALHEISVEPVTRDPFDRLLLAQAEVEDFQLLTIDRALVSHPSAWQHA